MTEPYALSLAGVTPLHRSLLSAHIAHACYRAGPWFRDSWVSVDDLAGLSPAEWDAIDDVLARFAKEYTGLIGAEFVKIRDDFTRVTAHIEETDAELMRGLSVDDRLAAAECSDHKPRQHRDGKPPWCRKCGLTAAGLVPISALKRRESGDTDS